MLGLLALVTASIFFGAAVYINIAEHPARLALSDAAALAEWRPAYRRGFAMQAPVQPLGGPLVICCGPLVLWIMLANWPYTLVAIMPTNHLLEATAPGGNRHTRERLTRWGHLDAVRSALSGIATLIYLVAAQRSL